jgi:hypothetical protein
LRRGKGPPKVVVEILCGLIAELQPPPVTLTA